MRFALHSGWRGPVATSDLYLVSSAMAIHEVEDAEVIGVTDTS